MQYQQLIQELDSTVNPAGVEAAMRLQYGTLDHLSKEAFKQEIGIAKACEKESPGFMKLCADSLGFGAEYAAWK